MPIEKRKKKGLTMDEMLHESNDDVDIESTNWEGCGRGFGKGENIF